MRSTGHETLKTLTCASLLALAAGPLGGGSFAIPPLVSPPQETTGSLHKIEQRLSADLSQEDTRRAKGALAIALDPQGNGKPVKWDNPDSRASGEIAAVGSPYVEGDEVCRRFRATTDPQSGPAKAVEGYACRLSANDWAIRDLK